MLVVCRFKQRFAKRIAAVAAGAAAIVLLLAGCSTPGAAPVTEAPTTAQGSPEGSLSIAAAASLEPAFRELAERFAAEHPGVTFENLSFDGSSTLAEQINGGAPFDVFASADEKSMMKVVDEGLVTGEAQAFATSSLEIAIAPGNPLGIETLVDLAAADTVVVVCAPEVPCGSASHKLLDRAGVRLTPASEEQNVTAVLQKVAAGEADAGLVYRSDVMRSAGQVEGIEIPGSLEAAGTYMIAPLAGSQSSAAAQAFADYVRSDEARQLLDELGFGRPRGGG